MTLGQLGRFRPILCSIQCYEQWALVEGVMGCFVVCCCGKWWGVVLNKSHHVGDDDYFFVARGEMVVCLCCRPHIGGHVVTS